MWDRFDENSFSVFIDVREMNQIIFGVKDADTDIFVREDLADLIADRIVDALNVEFGGEGGLHTVDDGEFRIALFGDLEQALGFIEETRVLERGSQRGGDGGQQAQFRFTIGIFAFMIFINDVTYYRITDDNWNIDR